MKATLFLVLWALVILITQRIISALIERKNRASCAQQLECKDVPKVPGGGLLGIRFIKQMLNADKDQLFPDFLVHRQRTMSRMLGRECSTFKRYTLGQEQYFTSEPSNIRTMLATRFLDYELGPSRRGNLTATLGDGIFVQDGASWGKSRALLRPHFQRDQISDLELEERHVQELFRVMPVDDSGWTPETDIQTLFFRLTMDSACEFLIGETVNSQSKADRKAVPIGCCIDFATHFDRSMTHLAKRSRLGDKYWFHNPKEFRDNNRIVNEFIESYVDRALEASRNEEHTRGRSRTRSHNFLDALLEQTQDPQEIRAQLLNILLAGRDTTASLLSWLVHELLRNPSVLGKLRESVITTFGTYKEPKDITYTTLKGCDYLQYCLSETLRLWTIVPINSRRTSCDTILPEGGGPDGRSPVYIKKNTEVHYSTHAMHRRKDLWGEDAEKFKPERFRNLKPKWKFLPFNGGPRICIGQQFALTKAAYVIVRLLQKFDKIERGAHEFDNDVVRSDLSLTNCPAKKVTVKMHASGEERQSGLE